MNEWKLLVKCILCFDSFNWIARQSLNGFSRKYLPTQNTDEWMKFCWLCNLFVLSFDANIRHFLFVYVNVWNRQIFVSDLLRSFALFDDIHSSFSCHFFYSYLQLLFSLPVLVWLFLCFVSNSTLILVVVAVPPFLSSTLHWISSLFVSVYVFHFHFISVFLSLIFPATETICNRSNECQNKKVWPTMNALFILLYFSQTFHYLANFFPDVFIIN